ncbi:hypothetical protein ACFWM3_20485 [Gottfriedia sp. NPDC058432]|uniref:hypothetical protein n=1 Tax=Gottfriedia sp. NPDC058432 TaxID=3346497 RepID=UPI00365424F0
MKRAVGIFLCCSAILTYLKINVLYDPLPLEETHIFNDLKDHSLDEDIINGVTTVKYIYPWWYWAICVILIITFILGTYFILAKEKQTEKCPLSDNSE